MARENWNEEREELNQTRRVHPREKWKQKKRIILNLKNERNYGLFILIGADFQHLHNKFLIEANTKEKKKKMSEKRLCSENPLLFPDKKLFWISVIIIFSQVCVFWYNTGWTSHVARKYKLLVQLYFRSKEISVSDDAFSAKKLKSTKTYIFQLENVLLQNTFKKQK